MIQSPDIDLQHITKTYRFGSTDVVILNNVSLQIHKGEMVAIMGASGSGKSTLMHIMGLLDKATSGRYWLQGKEVESLSLAELAQLRNQQIGFIFQSFYLLPRLTVLENVGLPLYYRKWDENKIALQAIHILEKLGMQDYLLYKPNQLSGGQQQRIAIARALAGNPLVILADEPTGSLDSKTGQKIMDLLTQLNQFEEVTIVIITHDEHIAKQCKRIIHIQDGKVIA